MITAIVLLAVVAFVAILAAVSFASLARKRLAIAESNMRAWITATNTVIRAENELADARAQVERLRAAILRRLDRRGPKDWTDEQIERAIMGIFAPNLERMKKDAERTMLKGSYATIDELMPNVLPEASE